MKSEKCFNNLSIKSEVARTIFHFSLIKLLHPEYPSLLRLRSLSQ